MDPTPDDIERYRSNRMTNAERHALEKRALSDPFLADAIEGANAVPAEEFAADLQDLQGKIKTPVRGTGFRLRLAAGVLLAVALGWLIWNPRVLTKTNSEQAQSTGSAVPDSIEQGIAETKPSGEPPADAASGDSQPATQPEVTTLSAAQPQESTSGSAKAAPSRVAESKEEAATEVETENRKASPENLSKRSASPTPVVSGKVTEAEDGIPLANVVVKDAQTRQETKTRGDGSYSLPVTSDQPVLRYSFPGLQSAERRAGQGIPTDVQLVDDGNQPSEVIAFAPGNWSSDTPDDLELAVPQAGLPAYHQYLVQNVRLPEAARHAGTSGKVTVSFTVDTDGSIRDLRVIKGLGHGCDEETMRLVQTGPSWKPARYRGAPAPSMVWVKLEFRPDP